MIPKIIHYCWLSNDPIPDEFKMNVDKWKSILYDYEFIKWDFSRFDINSSTWVKESFENKKYAFAADYIRLFAVYNYGGIYLDMDVEVLKKFDPLLEEEYMFAYESQNNKWIEAGCFGAVKHNGFIGCCLERYENRHFIDGAMNMDLETLPRIMEDIRMKHNIHINLPIHS